MSSFSVSRLDKVELSRDGRNMVIHFAGNDKDDISLTMDTMMVEITMTELGYVVTKARELSDLSKEGILSIFRPAGFRAELADGKTVVVSFAHENGLESHFGLRPDLALELARKIADAAERGKTAKPQSVN